jgi:multidrug efflux pump subunit AcrA (membrane-fusion protein)
VAPGHFRRREVKVLLENGGRSVIGEGLESGERVVVEGCLLLEAVLAGTSS